MQNIEQIAILDFGSQYTQLIARRIREMGVFTEIFPPEAKYEKIKDSKGIILSGGPASTYQTDFAVDPKVFSGEIPVLGICFGMQLMNFVHQGTVEPHNIREYGKQKILLTGKSSLFSGMGPEENVWMSHGDSVKILASSFLSTALSKDGIISAFEHKNLPLYGVQFHPEVTHTQNGAKILGNFLDLCSCKREWTMKNHLLQVKDEIRKQVGEGRVVSLVSGGVDSTAATLVTAQALGPERVIPIHIDNGLMRKGESANVCKLLREQGMDNLIFVDATNEFHKVLKGVTDPEIKRKAIGTLFIEILEGEIEKLDRFSGKTFFCQGTLYTDLIESGKGCGKNAAVIKSHHNVNPPIVEKKRKEGLILEPNRNIFKDEVRRLCQELGVPRHLTYRHPFPGPGLAIRIIGEVTNQRLEVLREVDEIFLDEIRGNDLYDLIWQAFAVLIPVSTVGVKGDKRICGHVIALRAVSSVDGMTADFYPMPYELLGKISTRIINEVEGISRVVYDTTSKPPGTIEWE